MFGYGFDTDYKLWIEQCTGDTRTQHKTSKGNCYPRNSIKSQKSKFCLRKMTQAGEGERINTDELTKLINYMFM